MQETQPSFVLNLKNYILFAILSNQASTYLLAPVYILLGFIISSCITTAEEFICSHWLNCANTIELASILIQRWKQYREKSNCSPSVQEQNIPSDSRKQD